MDKPLYPDLNKHIHRWR